MPEKRKSAFIRATQEAQQAAATPAPATTVTPLQSETVVPSHRELTLQREASSTGSKKDKKVTFYLTQEQEDKLDNLEIEFRQHHKRKVNRNEIIRFLIDQCNIDNLQGL